MTQLRIRSLLFSLLTVFLLNKVELTQSASISTLCFHQPGDGSTTRTTFIWSTRLRGGQESDSNESEEWQEQSSSEDDDITERREEDVAAAAQIELVRSKSPFRLLQEVREEVNSLSQSVANYDNSSEESVSTAPIRKPSERSSSAPPLVGGALTGRSKPVNLNSDNKVVTVPASVIVDANRVAPLSSRLMEEAIEEQIPEDDVSTGEDASPDKYSKQEAIFDSQVSRLWWTNVWTQQLSEIQNTSNSSSKEESIDYESEESESDPDITPANMSMEENSGQEEEWTPPEEAIKIEEDAESPDLNEEFEIEVTPIPTEVKANSTIDEDLFVSDEKKSFISSGAVSFCPFAQIMFAANTFFITLFTHLLHLYGFLLSFQWVPIDNVITFGLARKLPVLKLSTKLRRVRKFSARVTGLHGVLSGKPSTAQTRTGLQNLSEADAQRMQTIQKRIAALDKVREGVVDSTEDENQVRRQRFRFGRRDRIDRQEETLREDAIVEERKRLQEEAEDRRRQEDTKRDEARRLHRVKEIDRQISEGQARLQDLVCEKDVLQRRLNPLFNYSSEILSGDEDTVDTNSTVRVEASRKFKFPPDDLVEEYLDMTFSNRRIAKLNHTYLWQDPEFEEEDEELIGDDLLTPSADAFKLYREDREDWDSEKPKRKSGNGRKRGGGSWLLRQTLGKGPSIGEKIGEVAETAAYKAVCAAVMSFLAKLLSSLHGINVMKHSDIRLFLEQAPDLPRVGQGVIPGSSSDYAQETIKTVMRRNTKKGRRRSKLNAVEDSFVQRDAVTEMLLSHVQISAPLLKLFPLAWQRAFLGNIITLATSVMSDFFEGLQFQILGHSLTFAFAPITQEDMINHIGLSGAGFNSRRAKADEFEAAVRATAEDIADELKFLDRWHERALGSGVLRTQIANLVARIVLTLTDEILAGARMDLWSTQAGGPRMLAGLEYRTNSEE